MEVAAAEERTEGQSMQDGEAKGRRVTGVN